MQQWRPRAVLCLPLVKQAELIELLYLENNLAPSTFTAERTAALELLASQAAISLENARLYEGLRRSEAFLAEGQRLSQTGSWGWKSSTDETTWSPEHFRILGYAPGETKPSLEAFWQRVHPEDRPALQAAVEVAKRERRDFDTEFRIIRPDGAIATSTPLAMRYPPRRGPPSSSLEPRATSPRASGPKRLSGMPRPSSPASRGSPP
jgi:GAF domain-containing protein